MLTPFIEGEGKGKGEMCNCIFKWKNWKNRRVMKQKNTCISCIHLYAHALLMHLCRNSVNHTEIGMDGYAFLKEGWAHLSWFDKHYGGREEEDRACWEYSSCCSIDSGPCVCIGKPPCVCRWWKPGSFGVKRSRIATKTLCVRRRQNAYVCEIERPHFCSTRAWHSHPPSFLPFSLHVEVEGRIERPAERWVERCGKGKSWPLMFRHRYQFSYHLLAHISDSAWTLLATNSWPLLSFLIHSWRFYACKSVHGGNFLASRWAFLHRVCKRYVVYVCKSIILERAIRPGVPLNMVAGDGICCFLFGYIALGAIWWMKGRY